MPIFCSNLPNDQDLIKALGSIVIPCPLFTDVAFWGKGASDSVIKVGLERKKIGDLCQCMNDGRLLFQAQVAKENGIDTFLVITEGRVRSNPDDGLLEIPTWGINPRTLHRAEIWTPVRPTMMYNRFCQFLFELFYLAGIFVIRTEDVKETVSVIRSLWDFFQSSPDKHQSLKQIFKAPVPTVQLIRPSIVRRIASELDSIGWERSGAVAQHFKSVAEMVNASVEDWASITTVDSKGKPRRLGHKIAEKIVQAIRNGGTDDKES